MIIKWETSKDICEGPGLWDFDVCVLMYVNVLDSM